MVSKNLPPLSVWEVNLLRLTAFPNPTINFNSQDWWSEVSDETPETVSQSPKTGQYRANGPFQSGSLRLDILPNRIDWIFTVADNNSNPASTFPTIGILPDTLGIFTNITKKWFSLNTCPALQRLAFGAVLFQPSENKETGYNTLSKYLPSVTIDPIGSSDFHYRINRPRKSQRIDNLEINRLANWSVLSYNQFMLGINGAQVKSLPVAISFGCLLEIDINSKPDYAEELIPEKAGHLFDELVALGQEIVANGDVK